jgi:uncharacterized protein (TIGR02453 family)
LRKFKGFSSDGIRFLQDLVPNNDRDWFKANRAVFDEGIVEPGKALVAELGERLTKIDPEVQTEAKIGGSIFRQHRDTRFSKDKSPYKTHFDMWWWTGEKKGWNSSGFFLRVTGAELVIGAGMHGFDKTALASYRAAVGDDARGAELVKISQKLRKSGIQVEHPHYKRVPKPFAADHPRADLLRHDALYAALTLPLPDEVKRASLVGLVSKAFTKTAPLHHWLKAALR